MLRELRSSMTVDQDYLSDNMKFGYHWKDEKGITHMSVNSDEAEKALHKGFTVYLYVLKLEQENETTQPRVHNP